MGLSLAAGTVLQILVVRALRNGEALLNDEITSSSQGSRSSSRSAEMSSESFAVPNDLTVLAFVGRMYDGTPAPEPPVRPLVLPFFLGMLIAQRGLARGRGHRSEPGSSAAASPRMSRWAKRLLGASAGASELWSSLWLSALMIAFVSPLCANSVVMFSGKNSTYNGCFHMILAALIGWLALRSCWALVSRLRAV